MLYAAGGAAVWTGEDDCIGLVARVGEDYPRNWIAEFGRRGFDCKGIKIIPQSVDVRSFRIYSDLNNYYSSDPVKHFARLKKNIPKSLLGYRAQPEGSLNPKYDQLTALSIRQSDLPDGYQYASAAHICPLDFMTHSLMAPALRRMGITTITIDPGSDYMRPEAFDLVPGIVSGLTAFIPGEEEARALFKGKTDNILEILETMGAWGSEIVIIKRGERGQLLYIKDSGDIYEVPAYPVKARDISGGGDVFCGGFLVGYRQTYDPLQAAVHGNISASFSVEGSGPFYCQDALSGLRQARYESLIASVRKI